MKVWMRTVMKAHREEERSGEEWRRAERRGEEKQQSLREEGRIDQCCFDMGESSTQESRNIWKNWS